MASGVRRTVVVSSMSAYRGTRPSSTAVPSWQSSWRRCAWDVRRPPGPGLRPRWGGIAGTLRRLAVLPVLPDFGARARQFTVAEDDLAAAVVTLAAADEAPAVPVGIAHGEPVAFTALLSEFAAAAGRPAPHFVPTPPMAVLRCPAGSRTPAGHAAGAGGLAARPGASGPGGAQPRGPRPFGRRAAAVRSRRGRPARPRVGNRHRSWWVMVGGPAVEAKEFCLALDVGFHDATDLLGREDGLLTVSRPVGGVLSGPRLEGGRPGWPSIYAAYLGSALSRGQTSSLSPTFGLAPGGVYRAGGVTLAARALLPHPFTLACAGRSPPSAVFSLWHCPAGHPDWPLASTLLCGVPTFLDTIPSPVRAAATRPTHRRGQLCHEAGAGTDRGRVGTPGVGRVAPMSGGARQLFDPESPPPEVVAAADPGGPATPSTRPCTPTPIRTSSPSGVSTRRWRGR